MKLRLRLCNKCLFKMSSSEGRILLIVQQESSSRVVYLGRIIGDHSLSVTQWDLQIWVVRGSIV